MRAVLAIVAVVLLAGCQSQPERVQLPALVKVPVRVTVPVPEKLTAPCPVARAETRTVEAVVEAYNSNVETLEACNARMREIRALPVGEVPLMDERLDRLLALAVQQNATIVEQGRQIAQQAEQIGLLTQSVALLLGEEVGQPVEDESGAEARTDLDGNTY